MKKYLNKAEKHDISIQLNVSSYFTKLAERYIKLGRSKTMLKNLRTANTYLKKVIKETCDGLDPDEVKNVAAWASKLSMVLRTSKEALDEFKKMQEEDRAVTLLNEEFLILSSYSLSTCKTCTKCNYKECQLRTILMKYDVEHFRDSETHCQYQLSDIEPNSLFELHCAPNGDLLRVQPGLKIAGYELLKPAPLKEHYWSIPKVTVE